RGTSRRVGGWTLGSGARVRRYRITVAEPRQSTVTDVRPVTVQWVSSPGPYGMVVVVVPDDVLLVVDGRVVVVVVEVVEGHVNGPQVNAQLTSPTSHSAILRASPMLQAPSRLTSHASGCVSWLHCRSPTSNWATTSASPTSTIPSPFTSPQGTAATVVVAVGEAALPEEAVASRKERERRAARSPRAGKRKASSFTHLPNGEHG